MLILLRFPYNDSWIPIQFASSSAPSETKFCIHRDAMFHIFQEKTRSFSPSVYLHQREVLSFKGKKLCHVIIAWFSYAPSVCERASILLISGADWQCCYVCYLCMSERSALTWICRCCRLETEVLTWSDFGWAGNLPLYVESATRSKLAVLKEKLSVLEQQLE
jgi:hypothetical protein